MSPKDHFDFFNKNGYVVLDLFSEAQIDAAAKIIEDKIDEIGAPAPEKRGVRDWTLADYHNTFGSDDTVHRRVTYPDVRYVTLSEDFVASALDGTVLRILDRYWGHREPLITHERGLRDAKAPDARLIDDNTCAFRLVRPGTDDAAGVHVDKYYGNVAGIAEVGPANPSLITIWIPVVGFGEHYSLRLAPGSHTIDHPPEVFKKIPAYLTRVCSPEYESKFEYIRPKLRKGQAIVFHPNLLHGGSRNLGQATRVSLEIRLRDSHAFSNRGRKLLS